MSTRSEKAIVGILDLATRPVPEGLSDDKAGAVKDLRRIVASPNVVGVGVAEKVVGRRSTGKVSLVVYVRRKMPKHRLKASVFVPPTIDASLSGETAIATDVVAIGPLRPEQQRGAKRLVQPGVSVSEARQSSLTGTLGAIVLEGRQLLLLSNSHVFARSGKARLGTKILCPGAKDGGRTPHDVVARLHRVIPFRVGGQFDNRVDCALAKPDALSLDAIEVAVKGLGIPKGFVKPKRGMKIVKVGRTTGKTFGTIRDIHFRFSLNYDGVGEVGFLDQVLCTRYSQSGDSGALVLERGTGRAVGLHFAGGERITGTTGGSVFNPIDQVLKALGVRLAR